MPAFALDYTITSTEAEPPALCALLDKFGGTTGSLTGQYTPGRCSWRCTQRAPAPSTMPL
ncbi:MAG: hypothetical protein ACLVJH_01150 [Faecalibacterium prausnitzii]